MDENNKITSFDDLSSMFSEMEQSITNATKSVNNSNTEYHDDYADFIEFEDENGKIMLIKYSDAEYEFRGNRYCKYVLCDEKTGSRENGVAQIKNGQKEHIKDPERINKIKEYMLAERNRIVNSYSEYQNFTFRETSDEEDDGYKYTDYKVRIIGYNEGNFACGSVWTNDNDLFNDYISVLYQVLDDEDCEFIQIDTTYGVKAVNKYYSEHRVNAKNARKIMNKANFVQLAQITNIQSTEPKPQNQHTSNNSPQKNNILSGLAKFFKR